MAAGVAGARDAWSASPAWLRWLLAYVAAVGGAAIAGAISPLGVGNALFLVGALVIVSSLAFIRLGGETVKRVHRAQDGTIVNKERVLAPERRSQISLGVKVFLFGLAVWAWLALAAVLNV